MCLNLGICINFKANDANIQAFIDESLDNVLPKFRQCAKYFQDFTRLFLHFAKDFEQNL